MKKYIIKSGILILSLFLLFCTNNKNNKTSLETIDIEANLTSLAKVNLSKYFEGIRYIPLAKAEKIVLKQISLISCSDSLLFVSDLTNCLLYSSDGNYITKIGNQGRGSGEYRYVNNICITKNKKLIIQDLNDFLEYNLDGSFIRKYKQVAKQTLGTIQSWISINDSTFFGQVPNFSGDEAYKAIIFSHHGKILKYFRNYQNFSSERIEYNNFSNQANIYLYDGGLRFKERVNDTLFSISDDFKLTPLYVFKIGRYSIPYSGYFQSKIISKLFGYINNVFETTDYLFIDFGSNNPILKRMKPIYENGLEKWFFTNKILGIYIKDTKELQFVDITKSDDKLLITGLFNNIDGGPKFFPEFYIDKSTLAMSVSANLLKDYIARDSFKSTEPIYLEKKNDLEKLANSLSEFDNPVLIFVTVKK
jgi:hypothetical protein